MLNPCCGRDLHWGSKVVAVFDVVLSIIELAAAVVFESGPITIMSTEGNDLEKKDVNYVVSMSFLYGLCLVIMRIVQLGCSILLMYGVVERNYKKCEIWFIFNWVIVTLAILQIVYELFLRDKLIAEPISDTEFYKRLAVPGLEVLLNWYLMWVIFSFMLILKKAGSDGYGNSDMNSEDKELKLLSKA